MSKRSQLEALLEVELDFHGEDDGFASHNLHAFAAKFPPQLPRAFIRGLTDPGDTVLDPMMGSGTAVLEAILQGRRGVGLDIDPLALRLSRAKTTPLNIDHLRNCAQDVLARALALLSEPEHIKRELESRFDGRTKAFIDYWFFPSTQRELLALVLAIGEIADLRARHFLELTFSSVVITKSGGVSRARDLAHTRPHLDKAKTTKSPLEQFSLRFRKNLSSIAELTQSESRAITFAGDARAMPIADEVIDLIVTSPPYANAIDYMRAHKFSLVWLGKRVEGLSELRGKYIGSERVGTPDREPLPDSLEAILQRLSACDGRKAAVLRKYFLEMKLVFAEAHRVLRKGAPAIFVVGPSTMRGLEIPTHRCLADLANQLGFDLVGTARRELDRNRRMMPSRADAKQKSTIERRIHKEYVLGLLKPSCP